MNAMRLRASLIALLCTIAVAFAARGPAAAQRSASVRGRVEIATPIITAKRPASAYPSRAVSTSALASTPETRHVIVYVRDAPPRAVEPVRVAIRQRDEDFVPRVVAVPIGSEVEFPNDDPMLTPRWFAAGKLEGMTAPAPLAPIPDDQDFFGVEETIGYRVTPGITIRGGHRARRAFGRTDFDHQAAVSVVWWRRWW